MKPKMARYNLYLSKEFYDRLSDFSEQSGIPRSQIVTRAVERYLKAANKKNEGINKKSE